MRAAPAMHLPPALPSACEGIGRGRRQVQSGGGSRKTSHGYAHPHYGSEDRLVSADARTSALVDPKPVPNADERARVCCAPIAGMMRAAPAMHLPPAPPRA